MVVARLLFAAVGAAALLVTGVAAPAAAAPAAHAPRCTLETGRTTLTLTSGGLERTAIVYLPESARTKKPLPAVFDLHGSASWPAEELSRSGLEQTAERYGFLVVGPQGAIPVAAGYAWNVPYVTTVPGAPDDEAFLNELIDALVSTGCADRRRLYAAGYSGGGRMISQFACDNPDRFAAIALVAGLRAGAPLATGTGWVPDPATCTPRDPVPVVAFAGTADPVNPFTGGGAAYWGYSVPAALQRWAELNGCRRGPLTRQVTEHVSLVRYAACHQRADTRLYVVAGGGHTWPGADPTTFPPGLGPVTQEISANEIMWKFFRNRVTTGRR
jgi:polyhydroxybutyrate depolymerase